MPVGISEFSDRCQGQDHDRRHLSEPTNRVLPFYQTLRSMKTTKLAKWIDTFRLKWKICVGVPNSVLISLSLAAAVGKSGL
ncbi:hypothetical protein CEXT_232511 [Caerostris extrusa]|uniref:Uncharacterized protein n=1 Tax=Caerostris extrusa TaxID=172846 RepID=A0AAV4X6K1_CAEEX|nr:hypothetical protein CEXT_232511 [Caerostris extrusa]